MSISSTLEDCAKVQLRSHGKDCDLRVFNGVKSYVSVDEQLLPADGGTDTGDLQAMSLENGNCENHCLIAESRSFTVADFGLSLGKRVFEEGDPKVSTIRQLANSSVVPGDHLLLEPSPGCMLRLSEVAELDTKFERVSQQSRKVSILREGLRTEEARLSVFRKLLDSQRGRDPHQRPATEKQSLTQPSLHSRQTNLQGTPIGSSKGTVLPNSNSHAPVHPPASVATNKPVLQSVDAQPVQKFYIQVGNQLVPAPPPPLTASSGEVCPPAPYTSLQPYPGAHLPKPVSSAKQTPEQKQIAAKAALRRQLELALLQIPPPNPPSADWKAVPNVNSMDFMMLVGLDEVVDSILDIDDKPTLKQALSALLPYSPRICTQCKVDFSPCWKSCNKLLPNAITCERCFHQKLKKDLKAEHTSRLKLAFLKALKQEQEIEERIKAGEDVNLGSLGGGVDKVEHGSLNTSPVTNSHSTCAGIQPSIPAPVAQVSSRTFASSETPQHPSSSYHRHQVVPHYPHHTPLVHQVHQQHIHQQKRELEPPSQRHPSPRWHPYVAASHHNSLSPSSGLHRQYSSPTAGSSAGDIHPEYYVVHHPHHSSTRWQRT